MKAQPFSEGEGLYDRPSAGHFFSPFTLDIDPMEHLMLINFEKDPDAHYNVFELQRSIKGNGPSRLLVIAYRTDGAADIYHQPGFPFASQASILNDVTFYERPLEGARFEINADRLEASFAFEDKLGRLIRVQVNENKRGNKRPFFLLAPVGTAAREPTSFPYYALFEMAFTRRKHSKISISIDRLNHKADPFPLPIDGPGNYFTRYAADTFNVDWNRNYEGVLSPITPASGDEAEKNGTRYALMNTNGHYEISETSNANSKHRLSIRFFPPIPDMACMRNETKAEGSFSMSARPATGFVKGTYSLKRKGDEAVMTIHPNRGWQPNTNRWILKLLFLSVKVFRDWPKEYIWTATIRFTAPDQATMVSGWKRT